MSESSFKNHIYIAGRCTFCNLNWLDEDENDPDYDCIPREEEFVYTTNSSEDRKNLSRRTFSTDPAYYEFLQKQHPHLTMSQIKQEFRDFSSLIDEI